MNKRTMINHYRNHSAAEKYIIGFTYNHELFMTEVDEIMPRFLTVEQASRNQGENLRLRVRKPLKEQLLRTHECISLGSADQLKADKYNKGEIFEKLVTEYFGQTWEKDIIPFWVQGDINVNGVEIQIKLEDATLCNTKQIAKNFYKRGLTKQSTQVIIVLSNEREVNKMLNVIIDYSEVSPAVLDLEVRNATCNALCMWRDLNEDSFEFEVMGWLPMTPADLVKVEEVLARYV